MTFFSLTPRINLDFVKIICTLVQILSMIHYIKKQCIKAPMVWYQSGNISYNKTITNFLYNFGTIVYHNLAYPNLKISLFRYTHGGHGNNHESLCHITKSIGWCAINLWCNNNYSSQTQPNITQPNPNLTLTWSNLT